MLAEKFYTVTQAAHSLKLTPGRIRQICRDKGLGVLAGKTRLLSEIDLEKIRNREDGRKKSED